VIGGGAVAGALALGVRTPAQASQEGRDHILDVAIIGGGLSGLTSGLRRLPWRPPDGGPLGPRLAGQGEVSLADQLTAFKGGELQDPTQAMNGIADSLSEGEIKATARYVAGLTLVSNPGAESTSRCGSVAAGFEPLGLALHRRTHGASEQGLQRVPARVILPGSEEEFADDGCS